MNKNAWVWMARVRHNVRETALRKREQTVGNSADLGSTRLKNKQLQLAPTTQTVTHQHSQSIHSPHFCAGTVQHLARLVYTELPEAIQRSSDALNQANTTSSVDNEKLSELAGLHSSATSCSCNCKGKEAVVGPV